MELRLWSPFFAIDRDLRWALERFGRIFGDGDLDWKPFVDLYRDDDVLVVKAELPGIDPAHDLEITFEDQMLVMKGEKLSTKETTEADRYMQERVFGHFERRIPLPEGVDASMVTATYDRGVLTVRIPVPAERTAEPKKIPITVS